ncbi:hypothetical protein Pmar_PMAR018777 [Perkinsus marinus ATCC 50983]|uniref:Uncharacterized protein n=1 Tax=Perkinsus marinus (strain ATCC 50983 / TXsc) TaxID=423536 RepID=C5KJC4_PERM5|nr:hypothetical protein Pmar_PMAR018777 [Perkinsus marinus ATCC 50983]EER15426.1 hypothetical protein Pmar_PMAR018777 [Perkinsus marinus ATCC 50983]|eukprot:XP_002783630.1 hypothetical protein Pmar_PMAR018777 [Perkinsus marinus ATCC 50983]
MNYTAEFSKVRDELKKGDNKKDWRAAFNALDYTFLGQKVVSFRGLWDRLYP